MRTVSLAVSALSLCVLGANVTAARAQSPAEAKKAIAANLAKMASALSKKDLKTYGSFYADDAVIIDEKGAKKTKQQSMAEAAQAVQIAKTIKLTMTINSLSMQKGNAVANVTQNATITVANPQTKKDSTLVVKGAEAMTWVKRGAAWKIKQTKEGKTSLTVDGQPVPTP
jgi:ketosteroid isomerase-like protein